MSLQLGKIDCCSVIIKKICVWRSIKGRCSIQLITQSLSVQHPVRVLGAVCLWHHLMPTSVYLEDNRLGHKQIAYNCKLDPF